jgi:ribonuclease R
MPHTPELEMRSLLAEEEIQQTFPRAAREEAERWLEDPRIDDPALSDLTGLPFVTIDHESSRDLDQAAWVKREDDGFAVHYALADAAYYVRPGSALWEEALKRGASYYLPTTMVPMLPRELSEGLVSLNPEVDRRSTVFRTRLDSDGKVVETKIIRARIHSRHKLSFDRVQAFYDDGDDTGLAEGVGASLDALRDVGLLRMREAMERDVVRYRRTELDVGVEGMRFVVSEAVRHPVERYNEQLSLLCNIEGARILRQHLGDDRVQPIFRVHPPPERDREADLKGLLTALRKAQSLPKDTWDPRRARSMAEWLDQLPKEGRLGRIARAVHRQAVMVNGRSSYRSEPGIHYGVGAEVYARFSAPMREIVGIYLHKELWEALGGVDPEPERENLALQDAVVRSANRSRDLQRTLNERANEVVLDNLFANGFEGVGTVVGLAHGKVYVLVDDPPLDVKAYVPHVGEAAGKKLSIGREQVTLRDENDQIYLRLGDAVKVRVVGRDEERKRWKLALTEA